jgi:PAS domain S-box-containing protein
LEIESTIKANKLVMATNAFLEGVMESVTNVIFVIDPDENFSLVSKAALKITGYTSDELIGQSISIFCASDIFAELNKQLMKVKVMDAIVSQYETEIIHKDGVKVFVNMNLSPLYENGNIESIVGTIEDITQRKKLEGQLLQVRKLESIGQLAAGIAHEINTPTQYIGDNTRFLQESFNDIADMIGKYNNLLKADNISPDSISRLKQTMEEIDIEYLLDEIPHAIEQTLEGIDRVAEIVQAMKEFSHPGVEGKTGVDLNKAIKSTIAVARNEWKYTSEMKTQFDPELPLVHCLPGELNQVILNIIINASQAIVEVVGDGSEEKGAITISTQKDGDWAEIRISDTGPGIAEEIRDKVFDHFFTTKEIGSGSGQGLSIAHSIVVDKHGGTISLDTEIGKGTTFIIRMPINTSEK